MIKLRLVPVAVVLPTVHIIHRLHHLLGPNTDTAQVHQTFNQRNNNSSSSNSM
jgi:hypothetical protein